MRSTSLMSSRPTFAAGMRKHLSLAFLPFIVAFFGLALSCFAGKVQIISIPAGSAIYVDTKNGFDLFVLAAFQSKRVPLRLVSSRENADYVLDSSLFHTDEFVATPKFATTGRTSEAAFSLTATKSGDIIWAYAVTKGMLARGKQSVAEACAKHLKEIVK